MTQQSFSPPTTSLGAPKVRIRTRPGGPVNYQMIDNMTANMIGPVEAVLQGLPDRVFDTASDVEIRLFRFSRSKSRSAQHKTPARWAALPHIANGVNAYNGSSWLGGVPALLGVGNHRFSRVKLSGLAPGSTIDLMSLAAYWIRWVQVDAWDSATTRTPATIVASSWATHNSFPSHSWGVSRHVQPVRFGVAFIDRDLDGRWFMASGLTKFVIQNERAPFIWNAAHADNIAPSVGVSGRRIFSQNPGYSASRIAARLTDSEWNAGRQ